MAEITNIELVKNPHDLFFKAILNENGPLTTILSKVVPKVILDHLNPSTFFIDTNDYLGPKLRTSFSDVVVSAKINDDSCENPCNISFSFIFEHKSYAEENAILQLCHYCLSFWEKQLGYQHQLNLLVPLLVTHSQSLSTFKTKISDYFLSIPASLHAKITPSFEVIHIDLNDKNLYDKDHPHLYALYFLARCRNVQSIEEVFELFHLMRFDDPVLKWSVSFLTQCIYYLYNVFPKNLNINEFRQKLFQEKNMEILTQICDDVVFIKGKEEGIVEGKKEGKMEGKMEEKSQIIKNMISQNFNLEQIAKLTNTSIEWIRKNFS